VQEKTDRQQEMMDLYSIPACTIPASTPPPPQQQQVVDRLALDFILAERPDPSSPSPAPRQQSGQALVQQALANYEVPQSEPLSDVRDEGNKNEYLEARKDSRMSLGFVMSG